MKIHTRNSPVFYVNLEAENKEEAEYLLRFFKGHCKKLAKRFPLKDAEWKP